MCHAAALPGPVLAGAGLVAAGDRGVACPPLAGPAGNLVRGRGRRAAHHRGPAPAPRCVVGRPCRADLARAGAVGHGRRVHGRGPGRPRRVRLPGTQGASQRRGHGGSPGYSPLLGGLRYGAGRVGGGRGGTGCARVRGRPGHRNAARRPVTPPRGGLAGRNERQPRHPRRCDQRLHRPRGGRAGAGRRGGRGPGAGRAGEPARSLPRVAHHPPTMSARMCASVLADHGLCSSGRSGGPGGSGASHAASQKGWRALRVHRHSAARVSVTQPPAACIRRSPRRRKGPRSTVRMVAGTSGCSPGIPGAW